jgi:DNA-binding transcriptional LysR family regulator
MDIDLRQLRYFLKVAEQLNISAAARSMRMTQPALSRQIRSFEESLGWDLLVRGKKSIRLTKAGEVVLREGRRMQTSVAQGLGRMKQEIEGAEMRVGFAPSLAEGLIERAMASFAESYPKVRVSWFDSSTQEMWEGLEKGTLDLILEVATNDPEIRWEKLLEKKFGLAVSANHPLAKRRFIKAEHLDGERLLLLSRHEYPGYWEKVTSYFADHQVNAKIAGEFDGIASLRLGVEAGLGVAFVVQAAIVNPAIKVIPFKPGPDPICVSLGYASRRTLEPWEAGFLKALRKQ